MANDLIDPTTISKPEWCERLLRSVTRIENGVMIFPGGTALSSDQTYWLRGKAASLRSSLMAKATEGPSLASAVMGIFASFPAQALSERMAEAKMRTYLEVVSQYPLWAVSRAIRFWLCGEEGLPGDNYAFPPSPPQLVRLTRLAMKPVYQQIHDYEALLAAKTDRLPPTEEQKARVEELVSGFLKPMHGAVGR